MPKALKLISIILFFFSLLPVAFSQTDSLDSIRIVTYYPSPYGTYRELRTKRMAIGDDYIKTGAPPDEYDWQEYATDPMHNIGYDADLVVQGNVGIGTTKPAEILHVYGGGLQIEDISTSGAMLNLITKGDGSKGLNNLETKGWHLVARGEGYVGIPAQQNDLGLWFFNGTNSESRLFIEHDTGNVGIGTTSPNSTKGSGGYVDAKDVYLRDTGTWASEGGKVVQVVYQNYNNIVCQDNAQIILDGHLPQSSEGKQFMEVAIKPKNANNILRIEVTFSYGAYNSHENIVLALFKNNESNAIAAFPFGRDTWSNIYMDMAHFVYYYNPAGTTNTITFKMRAGTNTTSTSYDLISMNAVATGSTTCSASRLGGAITSSIAVTEITP